MRTTSPYGGARSMIACAATRHVSTDNSESSAIDTTREAITKSDHRALPDQYPFPRPDRRILRALTAARVVSMYDNPGDAALFVSRRSASAVISADLPGSGMPGFPPLVASERRRWSEARLFGSTRLPSSRLFLVVPKDSRCFARPPGPCRAWRHRHSRGTDDVRRTFAGLGLRGDSRCEFARRTAPGGRCGQGPARVTRDERVPGALPFLAV